MTGDITQVDLPRDQKSGLIVVSDILDGRRGRRVRALRRRGRRAPQARAADRRRLRRARPARRPELRPAQQPPAPNRIVVARGRRDRRRAAGDGVAAAPACCARRRRRGSRTATSPSSSSTPSGSPSSTREHRGKDGPTDVLSFPVDEDGAGARPARARRRRDLPGAHRRTCCEAVVHGVLHLTGMDHETDDGEMLALQAEIVSWVRVTRSGFVALAGPPERRQVDARQRDGRPEGRDRLRQAADDAARDPRRGHRRRTASSSCSPTCRACSARATR